VTRQDLIANLIKAPAVMLPREADIIPFILAGLARQALLDLFPYRYSRWGYVVLGLPVVRGAALVLPRNVG
jgi:hypothetical protein